MQHTGWKLQRYHPEYENEQTISRISQNLYYVQCNTTAHEARATPDLAKWPSTMCDTAHEGTVAREI